jgi:TP901 family phage tail tape measure protein
MAMNLDAVLRITAKVQGEGDLNSLQKGLIELQKNAESTKTAFMGVAKSALWQGAALGAAALQTGLVLATRAAIEFETSIKDIQKVMDGLDSPEAIQAIKDDIFELSESFPVAINGIADVYAAAAQAGVPREEIKQFTQDVLVFSTAWGMSAGEVGTALAGMRMSLGLTQPELVLLGDAINGLANNFNLTEPQMVDFVQRTASMGAVAGLSAQETAAFGAALISAGVNTEVAATSFNGLIKALSAGSSITERQISALSRMGLVSQDVAQAEQRLTDAVIEESNKRLAAASRETQQLSKEINRRYRDQLTALQDSWDDESEAQEKAIRRRYDAEIKAIQDRTKNNSDAADQQIEILRDAQDRELKLLRRAARDKQTIIKDQLDDQKDMELEAVQEKYKELEIAEKAQQKLALERAKQAAKEIAGQAGEALAKRLQTDAVGTITDIFDRIRKLPKEMQLSTIMDLAGEEAGKGLIQFVNNADLLQKTLALIAEEGNYAGSGMAEFAVRMQSTASQLQLTQNALDRFSVTIGEALLPALGEVVKALNPVFVMIGDFAKANPGITAGIVLIAGALGALVLLAPGLLALGTVLKGIGITLSGAFIATAMKGLLGFLGWVVTTLVPGLVAAIGGWPVLAVVALVAALIIFREPIIKFFQWVGEKIGEMVQSFWQWGEPIRQFWAGVWEGIKDAAMAFFEWWQAGFNAIWDPLKSAAASYFEFLGTVFSTALNNVMAIAWQVFVQPWINLWENVLRAPVSGALQWIQNTWSGLAAWFDTTVTTPISDAWGEVSGYIQGRFDVVKGYLQAKFEEVSTFAKETWITISEFFDKQVVQPIEDAWGKLMKFIPDAVSKANESLNKMWESIVNTAKGALRGVLQFIANGLNAIANEINKLIRTFNKLPGPDIALVPSISVPAFANGGYVTGPTLGLIGEGGEPEYIIPASKMNAAAQNYAAGNRGASVLNPVSAATAAPVQVSIQTGPVIEVNGERHAKISDLKLVAQQTAAQIYATLRTPNGRRAVGLA